MSHNVPLNEHEIKSPNIHLIYINSKIQPRRMGTNKTLEGHKLLILTWDPPSQFIDNMHQRFPGLRIVCRKFDEWSPRRIEDVPSDEWEDTTVLLTFRMLPKPEMAPKMQYVQIMSAGANHVLQTPLFLDTDVAFCTANGVHGYAGLCFHFS